MSEIEIHPWKYFLPTNSTKLIIGTFPSAIKNRSFDFFYPNKTNLFWKLLAKAANINLQYFAGLEAIRERKQILEKLRLGITDMGYEVIRHDGSSLDEKLRVIRYMDIFSILDQQAQITKLLFTSSSGPSSASGWFLEYLRRYDIVCQFPKGSKPLKSEFQYKGRTIELVILYSPSQRAANRITFEKLFEMYASEIC